eukprot:TRINITY_DN54358_c0_g1_i1.p2 TRINITY_DN54358_c0_g1~~TRINITY_DN54358_c0_g1_i1.p2  ORF type:complete len:569 (+),score=78.41 TRINITY_DN54358_c0_g1_i1:66-1772(+)
MPDSGHPAYYVHIHQGLVRNNRRTKCFQRCFKYFNQMAHQNLESRGKLDGLIREASQSKQRADLLAAENEALQHSSSGSQLSNLKVQTRVAECEEKISALTEELQKSYKNKSEHQQQIIELHQSKMTLQKQLDKVQEELVATLATKEELQGQMKDLQAQLDETSTRLRLVKEELQTRMDQATQDNADKTNLRAENNELIARMMQLKLEQAETINQMTELNAAHQQKINTLEYKIQQLESGNASRIDEALRGIATSDVVVTKPPKTVNRRIDNAHNAEINAVAFDPFGNTFATGGNDKVLRLWSARTCDNTTTLHGPTQSVMTIKYSNSGEKILATSNDHGCYIWSTKTSRLMTTLTGHSEKLWAGGFCNDERIVVTAAYDRTIRFWDLNAGAKCLKTAICHSSCNDLCTIPIGNDLVVTAHFDFKIRLWDPRTQSSEGSIDDAHDTVVTSVAGSPDGTAILSNGRDGVIKVWDIRTFKQLMFFKHDSYDNPLNYGRVCYSPDGKYICAGSGGGRGNDAQILVWDGNRGKCVSQLKKHTSCIPCLAWHPEGQFMVSVSHDKSIIWWTSS